MKFIFSIFFLGLFASCMKGKHVDLIVHNAKIHTVDEDFSIHEAMAIKDGKVVEVGPERQILNKYTADEEIDANGKDVFPSFSDAHGHILSQMEQRLNLDLTQTKSEQEMLFLLEKYGTKNARKFIIGRGWDQANWKQAHFPTNENISKLFPNTPVLLIRIDGHAALANEYLLKKAGLNAQSTIQGGKVELKNGKPTGIILDNAITEAMKLFDGYSYQEKENCFLEIQEELLQLGIFSVHEAGMYREDFNFFKKINDKGKLKIQLYGMLYPTSENIAYVRKNGRYQKGNFTVRSFKIVGDGSLGSRGAFLKKPYSDDPHNYGHLLTSVNELNLVRKVALSKGFQVNTHAIGDSTNRLVMEMYANAFAEKPDHRWRIEHAQVLDVKDIPLFAKYAIFPSVQPTHAVSDQRWAEQRIGTKRLEGAYAYQSILQTTGVMCLGTDFPIESFDPFGTIHAAVYRKTKSGEPIGGFRINEALTFEQCIKGMTFWAAFACFKEKTQGSLEKGKDATFSMFSFPVKTNGEYRDNFADCVFIKGKKVYSTE